MSKIMILLPNGYEEIEALTVCDFCRRASMEVDLVSITGSLETRGDHNIVIMADKKLEDVELSEYDAVVTPGGVAGTNMLKADSKVLEVIQIFFESKKLVASICASPLVLEAAGVAKKIEGTIYPGFEDKMSYAKFLKQPVVRFKNVITSRGPATAPLFAYAIIEYLEGKEVEKKVKNATLAHFVFKAD